MRHKHLLGLIGRPIPPTRQNKGRREGGLTGITRTPFSPGKQNHRERQTDHLYMTEKVAGQHVFGLSVAAQYSGMKADVDSSENGWWTMNSNCLAVFTDEVKVVSVEPPRSSLV